MRTERHDLLKVASHWKPQSRSISFVLSSNGDNVWEQPIAGGPLKQLTGLAERALQYDWSRDGRLAFSAGHPSTDAVLIGNLR
jgi:hypothetical protein